MKNLITIDQKTYVKSEILVLPTDTMIQHLYFLSVEELDPDNYIGKYILDTDGRVVFLTDDYDISNDDREILATTDESLNMFNDINDKTLYLPRPSNSFLETYYKQSDIDEVLIEVDEFTDIVQYSGEHDWKDITIRTVKLAPDNTITIKID